MGGCCRVLFGVMCCYSLLCVVMYCLLLFVVVALSWCCLSVVVRFVVFGLCCVFFDVFGVC